MRTAILAVFMCAGVIIGDGASASAQTYTLLASGKIDTLYGNSGTYQSDGRVSVGDNYNVSITYNTSSVVSSTTQNGSDKQTIYTIPATYEYTIGSYHAAGSFNSSNLIINDNHDLNAGSGSTPYRQDSIGFINFNGPTNDSPFTFGSGSVYPSFQVDAYDQSLQSIDDTNLTQIQKFQDFPNQFSTFSFVNSSFDNSVTVNGNIASARLIAGAPEPATWSLMILGFGIVGSTLRRQKRRATRGDQGIAVA